MYHPSLIGATFKSMPGPGPAAPPHATAARMGIPSMAVAPHTTMSHPPRHGTWHGGRRFGWPWWGGYWPWGGYLYAGYGYGSDVCASVRNAYLGWQQALGTGNLSLAQTLKAALDGVMVTSSCPARGAYFSWQQAEQAGIAPLAAGLKAQFEATLYQGMSGYPVYPYYGYGASFGFPYGGYPLGSLQIIGKE